MVDGSASLWATFKVAFTGQQDLTTYIKGGNDPDPFTSVTSTTATQLNLLNNEDNFLYRDYGEEAFGDFIHLFRFRITGLVTTEGGAYDRYNFWAVTNYVNDYTSQSPDNNENVLTLVMRARTSVDPQYQLRIRGDGEDTYIAFQGTLPVTYYAKITKVGAEVNAQIYTDSARTNLKDSGTITLQADRKYRYAYATQGLDDSQSGYGSAGSTSYFKFYDLFVPTPKDLKAGFYVKQWHADLKAEFHSGQGTTDFKAEFTVKQPGSADLKIKFRSGYVINLTPTMAVDDYDPTKVTLLIGDGEWGSVTPEQTILLLGTEYGAPSEVLKAKFFVNAGIRNLKAGFWVTLPSEALKAGFRVGQQISELKGEFRVAQPASQDLKAGFNVPQGYADLKAGFDMILRLNLKAIFTVQPEDTADLKAGFNIRQDVRNLYAKFSLPSSASLDLKMGFDLIRSNTLTIPAEFVVRQGSADLKAAFTSAQGIVELKAGFDTMWSPIPLDIHGAFTVGQGIENLLGHFTVTNQNTGSLPAKFRIIENTLSRGLKAGFEISLGNYKYNLPAQFFTRLWYANLKAGFFRGILDAEDLNAGFMIRQITGDNLSAQFTVGQGSADLAAGFTVKQWYADLKAGFNIRQDIADLLGEMHVNYGEDYQTYTEYDPTGILSLTAGNEANEVVMNGALTEANIVAKLYRTLSTPYEFTYGAGDRLEIQVEGYIQDEIQVGDGNWVFGVLFAISNSVDDIYTQWDTGGAGYSFFALTGGHYSSGDPEFILISRCDNQGTDEGYLSTAVLDTKYYFTIIRDPNLHPGRVYVYQYSNEARSSLIDSYYVWFDDPGDHLYIHAAGLWPYDDTELDGDIVNVKASKLRIVERIAGEENLPAQFNVGQGSVELKAGFWTPGQVIDLLGQFAVQSGGSTDLLGEFAVRRSSSRALKASFEGQTSRNLKAVMTVYHPNSEDMLGEFIVRHLTESYTVIVEDAWNTWLNYWVRDGTGRLSHPIRADDITVFYSGSNSHKIYTQDSKYGSESLIFGWSRTPYSDLLNETIEDLKAEIVLRHVSTLDLAAGFTVLQGREDLKASMKVVTPDSVELAAGFTISHPASEDLLGELIVRQEVGRDLLAGFIVEWLPDSAEVKGILSVRQPSSAELKAVLFVQIPYEDLKGALEVRRSASRDLRAGFDGQATQSLKAELIVKQLTGEDLLAGFTVKHETQSGATTIVEDNWEAWANYWVRTGTGFISLPVIDEDAGTLRVNLSYSEDEKEALIFGWNQYPYRENTANKSASLKAGFSIS